MKCNNNQCKWKYSLPLSSEWKGRLKALPIKLLAGFILSGLTYDNYSDILNTTDIETTSQSTWNDLMKQLIDEGGKLLQSRLSLNREKSMDFPIMVASDGAWSHRGWSANECVVAVFDMATSDILDVDVVIRKLPGDNYGNFEGASSQMESNGLRNIFKRLHSEDIEVAYVLHDGDGSTLKVAKEFWPNAEEIGDCGHACKNFRKAIVKLAKSNPELKNLGSACIKAFRHSILHCEKGNNYNKIF